jgi:hypothetical protein
MGGLIDRKGEGTSSFEGGPPLVRAVFAARNILARVYEFFLVDIYSLYIFETMGRRRVKTEQSITR